MNERRFDPEDLEEVAGLEPGDPALRDLDARPRLRAQLRAYRDFLAPGDVPADARVADAEAGLLTALEREIGVPLGGDAGAGSTTATERHTVRAAGPGSSKRGGWPRRALPGADLRPALAVATLIVVAGAAWLMMSVPRDAGPPIMRGQDPAPSADVLTVKPAPGRLEHGTLRLEWSPSPEADGYAVVFLSIDLEEIVRVEGLEETRLDLVPGAPPAGLESGRRVLWRAVALSGSDEVARSPAQPITVP